MAQERDEMERRRKKRAAMEKKRRAEQKKMRIKLVLIGIVFVLCCAVVLIVGGNRDKTEAPELSGPEAVLPIPEETVPPTEEVKNLAEDGPTTTIHIRAAGDLNVTDLVVASGSTNYGDDYFDYTDAFLDVAALLSNADLTVLNFEGNLVGPPYGTQTGSAPQQLMEALDAVGVDIVQMANSYSIYNGIIGLAQTLNNIRAAGIEPIGAYANQTEFEKAKGYTICDVQGIKVAVVAFTKGMSGYGLPAGSENCVNKLYQDYESEYKKVDYEGIRAIMKNVRSENPDITIAMLHWGAEYNDTIFKTQTTIAELMMDEGVDIILGTHPHMVHEVVFDKTANTLIAYSLGDFFGDATKGGTNYSILLDIQITRDNELGITRIDDFTVHPLYTLSEAEGNGQRRVVRIEEAVAAYEVNFVDKVTKSAYDSMINSLDRIEQRIANPKMVECPKCGKDLEILVNKQEKLVTDKTCACGEVLKKDSDYSDYR